MQAILLAALLALAAPTQGDYSPSVVPGLYKFERGSTACESDLRITTVILPNIPGVAIFGTHYRCVGGPVRLMVGTATNGNGLSKKFAASAPSVGRFIVGKVQADVRCRRRDGGLRTFPREQVWNFVQPTRSIPLDFGLYINKGAGLALGWTPTTLRRGRRYLFVGDDCLYRRRFYVCFPGSARVTLEGGTRVRIDEVRAGDRVAVGGGRFSEVFMWTHREATDEQWSYTRIATAAGRNITLTAGHFLRASGRLVEASAVRVGDTLTLEDGRESPVVSVGMALGQGFYNPQTLHGDIVVDGIVASTYTAAVSPAKAHAALAPLRGLHRAAAMLRQGVKAEL